MTRILGTAAAALMLGALGANAMTDKDTNGDGVLSLEEFLGAYDTLTAAEFDAADTNANGTLDADEVAAAETAGVLPVTEG